MTRLGINLDDYEEPKPVPEGTYIIKAMRQELKQAKISETEMIAWEFEIVDEDENPELNGRKLFHNTTIKIDDEKDPDGSKTAKSLGYLKKFFNAFGYQWGPKGFDPEDLVKGGNRALAKVTVEKYEGNDVNRIQSFNALAA